MKRNGRADELAKKSPERNPRPPTAQHRFALLCVPTSGSTARGTKPRIHRPRQGNRADVQFGTLQNVVHSAGASSVPRQVARGGRWQAGKRQGSRRQLSARRRGAGPTGTRLRTPNPPQWTALRTLLCGDAVVDRPRVILVASPLILSTFGH